MPDAVALDALVREARAFLSELAENNRREWFHTQKTRYDTELKRPAERLLADLTPQLEQATGLTLRPKLFRPHRDIRFSTDKTPYHTHLHLAWSAPDGRGWYFGLSPDYATAGAGIMSFDTAQQDRWHSAVAGPRGDDLLARIDGIGGRVDPPALKRVPAPYPADHPRGELLRRKGLAVWLDDLDDALQPDPSQGLATAFDRLTPIMTWLHDAL